MTVREYIALHDCSHCARTADSAATITNTNNHTNAGNNNGMITFKNQI